MTGVRALCSPAAGFEWSSGQETLRVEPWGPDGIRVRARSGGPTWTDAWTGERHQGGQTVRADEPLARIPLFLRDGASLPIASVSG